MSKRRVWVIEQSQRFQWRIWDTHYGMLSEAKSKAKDASQGTGSDFRIRTEDYSIMREIRGVKGGW